MHGYQRVTTRAIGDIPNCVVPVKTPSLLETLGISPAKPGEIAEKYAGLVAAWIKKDISESAMWRQFSDLGRVVA